MSGTMQAANIIATLAALDGCQEDINTVLAIEAIAEKYRETERAKDAG
jgi:hypothetical protein